MEKWKKATVELLSRLVVGEMADPSIAPYIPSKTVAMPHDEKRFFKRLKEITIDNHTQNDDLE